MWDTTYSLVDIFDSNRSFGDVYQFKNMNKFISLINVDDVSFLKCISALLITPSNIEQVYRPSSRERE